MKGDWRNLFSSPNQTLKFCHPTKLDDEPIAFPPPEVFSKGANQWRNALVAQFVGKPLNFSLFQRWEISYRETLVMLIWLKSHYNLIGYPLYMDQITTSRDKLAFAKVCVEIVVQAKIPSYMKVAMCDGTFAYVSVEVPWFLQKCRQKCSTFSHDGKYCPEKVTTKWMPKDNSKSFDKQIVEHQVKHRAQSLANTIFNG
ncbi:hypothetical protein PTKIN_Ptkin14bG0086700 [Pterospermum kingtungense]